MSVKFVEKEELDGGQVRLHAELITLGNGGISLTVTSDKDETWHILRITPEGTIVRSLNVPARIGFQLEAGGKVVLER